MNQSNTTSNREKYLKKLIENIDKGLITDPKVIRMVKLEIEKLQQAPENPEVLVNGVIEQGRDPEHQKMINNINKKRTREGFPPIGKLGQK